MRKLVAMTSILMLVFLFTSCGSPPSVDESGKLISYDQESIGLHSLDGLQGVFIKTQDDLFYPLAHGFDGYKGPEDKVNLKRYVWLNNINYINLIPSLSSLDELVIIYNSDNAVPDSILLEEYKYLGPTIGAHFIKTQDSIYLKSKGALAGTSAYNSISYLSGENIYEIFSINNQLPLSNIDPNIEMLLGLEYGKYYELGFYKGTKTMSMTLCADTVAFQMRGYYPGLKYEKTSNGYFKVVIPSDIPDGYYYAAGYGMLKLERGNTGGEETDGK